MQLELPIKTPNYTHKFSKILSPCCSDITYISKVFYEVNGNPEIGLENLITAYENLEELIELTKVNTEGRMKGPILADIVIRLLVHAAENNFDIGEAAYDTLTFDPL